MPPAFHQPVTFHCCSKDLGIEGSCILMALCDNKPHETREDIVAINYTHGEVKVGLQLCLSFFFNAALNL